jgi:hypothetical protein
MVSSVTTGGAQKLPKDFENVETYWTMTIHWKAL